MSEDASSASSSANTLILQLPQGSVRLSELFAHMEARPEAAKIIHWSLRQPSLEEVFLKLSRLAEAEQHGLINGSALEKGPERQAAAQTTSTVEAGCMPSQQSSRVAPTQEVVG